MIEFLKAGDKLNTKNKSTANTLSLATDWKLRADLGTRLRFSDHIVQTLVCPDIVLSNNLKKIIMWELTVPWEEYTEEEAHERRN